MLPMNIHGGQINLVVVLRQVLRQTGVQGCERVYHTALCVMAVACGTLLHDHGVQHAVSWLLRAARHV